MKIETSSSIAALAAALAKSQGQISSAPKSAVNPHFRSHYADLASIVDASRAALTANGLAVVQCPVDSERADSVALTTRLMHSSGEWLESSVSTRLQKNDAQGVGSALTYLRRYSLAAIVGVTSCEDDDGNAASQSAAPTRAAPPPPPPAAKRKAPPAAATDSPFVSALVDLSTTAAAMRQDESTALRYEVVSVSESSGEKSGKPWTRFAVELRGVDGVVTKVSTFSATMGATARNAAANNQEVAAAWREGTYGLMLDSLAIVGSRTEANDAIPF